jgi:hypothetical protein
MLNTSVTNINRWENGRRLPVSIYAEKIAELYEKALVFKDHAYVYSGGTIYVCCGSCLEKTAFMEAMLTSDRTKLVCKKCYYTVDGGKE